MIVALVAVSIALVAAIAGLIHMRAKADAAHAARLDAEREFADRLTSKESERAALRAILDGLGEGLLAIDRDRRVMLANRRFIEMFHAPSDLLGRPLGEVVRIAAVFDACDAALGGAESIERFSLASGATERRIEVRAMPFWSQHIDAVVLFIDVTQLERLEQTRRNFISDFSHEVRTPLAALTTAVESYEIGSHAIRPEDDQHLRRIMARQLKRLQRLVDDLSELSRIESGDLTLDLRDVGLLRLTSDLAEDFADRAAQRDLRIVVAGEDVHVPADAVRLQQAFANLIDNAIKYGGHHDTIDIAVGRDDSNCIVTVTDHGDGIPEHEKDRIFRRFYRIDKSRSQDVAGTGLGLAITKHLVLIHGGSIQVADSPAGGTTFIVRLPLGPSRA